MSAVEVLVPDASVGVKWFRGEAGQEAALEMLDACSRDAVRIVVPTHFVHEVLSVVSSRTTPSAIVPAWELMLAAGVDVVPLTDDVVREVAVTCERLGCSFYDALAPAIASLLGATLVSADARAHGAYPGVRLIP